MVLGATKKINSNWSNKALDFIQVIKIFHFNQVSGNLKER